MLSYSDDQAQICVVGRTNFSMGLGSVTAAACELLARSYPICILPTEHERRSYDYVTLPNSREVKVCKDVASMKVFFFTDVLWNGAYDLNFTLVPRHGLKIAHIAYDSDELPSRWVQILNQHFDVALFSSSHMEPIAAKSGLTIPVGTLPIALDIDELLASPIAKSSRAKVTFGSVAAFHERKGIDVLTDAFVQEFGGDDSVELVLHSNLSIGPTLSRVEEIARTAGDVDITITHEDLDPRAKNDLLRSFDVLVNCSRGEGYSIAPREALALGKCLVLSDIGAHSDLFGPPGVFKIATSGTRPARYPEIDNQVFGKQHPVSQGEVRKQLRQAYEYVVGGEPAASVLERRRWAKHFAYSGLALSYTEVIDPLIRLFKPLVPHARSVHLPEAFRNEAIKAVGARTSKLTVADRIVVPCHDGGFFSVFNAFMTHLAWESMEDRCHLVLPDWDVGRLLDRLAGDQVVSFCYGTPSDGNVWTKLFEPLYGLSTAEMDSEAFLYGKASPPERLFNELREPMLTHSNAYDLYKSSSFQGFRAQYNKVLTAHVKPNASIQQQIEKFAAENLDYDFLIAAHVKHPSHIIEQATASIAQTRSYISSIYEQLRARGISSESDDWAIFLATDQDRVVSEFNSEFGERVKYVEGVRRTSDLEDSKYDDLSANEKGSEGFQVQHLVAADPSGWSTAMAREVITDAYLMARCSVLLHVVSNVSTAVSYLNPAMELVFCD